MGSEIVINAYCGCADEKGIWFIHRVLPVLFYYNFANNKIEKWKVIPIKNEMSFQRRLFSAMVKVENKIFIIAGTQGKSYIYDIKSEQFNELRKLGTGISDAYFGAYLRDDYICITPFLNSTPKRVYLENLLVEDGMSWHECCKDSKDTLQNQHGVDSAGNVYIPIFQTNRCMIYDISKDKWTEFVLQKDIKCDTMTVNKEGIYMYDSNSYSLCNVDNKGKIIKKKYVGMKSAMLYSTDDFILVDGVYDKKSVIFDNELNNTATIDKVTISNDFNDILNNCFWINVENKLCGILKNNKIVFVNRNGVEKENSVCISEKDWEKIKREYMNNTIMIKESRCLGIKKFIDINVNPMR